MSLKNRVKISASLNDFNQEINRLQKFDFLNQQKFSNRELTKAQIELLVESIFFSAFRSFEGFLREVFILYCMEKQSSKRPKVKSYLKPRTFEHTEQMIKSSMEYLDWTNPSTLVERSEMYLANNGHPIKLPITTNLQQLKEFKKIRNHIAHNSIESETHFIKIVRTYNNGVQPLRIPNPGEYLMFTSKRNRSNYLLLDFLDLMKQLAIDLT